MYRARDAVDNEEYLAALDRAAAELDLDDEARHTARDLFLTAVPDDDRSKPAVLAASLYAGARIAGDGRSQSAVADSVGVSRLTVQGRWRELLREAGFEPPAW